MGRQHLQYADCLVQGTGWLKTPYKTRSRTHACRSGVLGASAGQRFHQPFVAPFGVSAIQTLLQTRRRSTSVGAGEADQPFLQYKEFASTQLFRVWIQGAVFLVVLAVVDAAFSGDWSRIGVISKEVENGLKPLVFGLGLFHVGCSVVAARSASEKNLDLAPAVLKVLAVGFLAMVEVLLADPKPKQ